MSKLNLDRDKVDYCRKLAKELVDPICREIQNRSTVSVERSVLRLLGIDQAFTDKHHKNLDADGGGSYPLVNIVVDKIGPEKINKGVAYWMGRALCAFPKKSILDLAKEIAHDSLDLDQLPDAKFDEIRDKITELAEASLDSILEANKSRIKRSKYAERKKPLLYVIVATGNIHEDVIQAKSAAKQGADVIAVIRSTAQSLLDHVPEGATTEGFGGTYATGENFRLMRKALDEVSEELKRPVFLTNYSSGLCMSEIAVLASQEGLDYLLNDSMYGILFRDINMNRTFIDQHFSRMICAYAGITIQTGEDNYLTTADSHKYWHQVLGSHFINEELAKRAGLHDDKIALGHAFEMDPSIEDSWLFELAQAQLVREVFPRCPIKYMPPTKHKQGDVFFSYLYDGLFNLTSAVTGQNIVLLGMLTEAIHNPFMHDRHLALKNAKYIFNAAKNVEREIYFQPNGKIVRRARHVLDETERFLKKIKKWTLKGAIERGLFANISRNESEGKGGDGVFEKDRDYFNPYLELLNVRKLRRHRQNNNQVNRNNGNRLRNNNNSNNKKLENKNSKNRNQNKRNNRQDRKNHHRDSQKELTNQKAVAELQENQNLNQVQEPSIKPIAAVEENRPLIEKKQSEGRDQLMALRAARAKKLQDKQTANPLPNGNVEAKQVATESVEHFEQKQVQENPQTENQKSSLNRRPLKQSEDSSNDSAQDQTQVVKPRVKVHAPLKRRNLNNNDETKLESQGEETPKNDIEKVENS